MNLHLLIPTLRQSCSLVLAYHDAGIIGQEAAFHIGFDTRNNPQIIFFGHTEDDCPKHINFSEIIIAGCLHNIADTIAGMALSHEKGVERMAGDTNGGRDAASVFPRPLGGEDQGEGVAPRKMT